MVCLVFEPGFAGCKAWTNPLSYGGNQVLFWKQKHPVSFVHKLRLTLAIDRLLYLIQILKYYTE